MAAQGDARDLDRGRAILRTILGTHLRWKRSRLAREADLSPSTVTRFLGDPERGTPASAGLGTDAAASVYQALAAQGVDPRLRDEFLVAVLGRRPRRLRLSRAIGADVPTTRLESGAPFPTSPAGRLAGQTEAALRTATDESPDEVRAWDRSLRAGIEYYARGELSQADAAFRLAGSQAASGGRGAEALVLGSRAQVANDRADFGEAARLTDDGLRLLRVADRAPERLPSLADLARRLGDDLAWRAYARLAAVRGRMAQDRRAFPAALAAYETVRRIGEEFDDGLLVADADQRLGTVRVEMGTQVLDSRGRIRWTVTNPESLERALQDFAAARRRRPAADDLGLALDCLNEAGTRYLLGEGSDDLAGELEHEAAQRFGDRLTRVNVVIKQARRATAVREDGQARRAFGEAAELAWIIGSPYYFADALGSLAALMDLSGSARLPVLGAYAAALVAWPLPIHRQGYERFGRFFDGLRPTRWEIKQVEERSGSWLSLVRALPDAQERLEERVRRRVYRPCRISG